MRMYELYPKERYAVLFKPSLNPLSIFNSLRLVLYTKCLRVVSRFLTFNS